ncbi:hypothetical protein [Aerosakkonema funiforme]|uniref:hypothetical protein n=1 Tax=Aerosakkonema funiforme TaxID=1246630 RepID=UPI0035B8EB13
MVSDICDRDRSFTPLCNTFGRSSQQLSTTYSSFGLRVEPIEKFCALVAPDRIQPSGLYAWTTCTRSHIIAAATTVPLGITPQHQSPKPD